jgi:hypothetical protein
MKKTENKDYDPTQKAINEKNKQINKELHKKGVKRGGKVRNRK